MNWWMNRIYEAIYPRCEEEEETPDHIVFRCKKIKRIRDVKGRVSEKGMRWENWHRGSG